MSGVINSFMDLPFQLRVVLSLFLFVFVLGKLLGNKILWLFSAIPYLLQNILRVLYLLIQSVLSVLHKKIGWFFGNIDQQFVGLVEEIDKRIGNWYQKWRKAQKPKTKTCLLVFIISSLLIIVPSYMKTNNKILKAGENAFLQSERFMMKHIKASEWYDAKEEVSLQKSLLEKTTNTDTFTDEFGTTLIVAGLNSTLLVRDVPDVENSVVLERLYNNDSVIWNGELAFAYADNRIESWVKITMQNGIKGWCRMDYLYPVEYEKEIYYVTKSQNMIDELKQE